MLIAVADALCRVQRNKSRIDQEEDIELKEQGKLLETLSDIDRTRLFDISKEVCALLRLICLRYIYSTNCPRESNCISLVCLNARQMMALTANARELGEEGKVDEAYRVMSQVKDTHFGKRAALQNDQFVLFHLLRGQTLNFFL